MKNLTYKKNFALIFIYFLSISPALSGPIDGFKKIMKEGKYDFYLTGYAWHNRSNYTREKINQFNENAFGGGLGKSLTDANGHQHLLYAFAFLDSHKKIQPIAGYARQWYLNATPKLALGLGYTVGVTRRGDILNGIPFPVALPIASIRWSKISLMGTYIPSLNNKGNNGNVAFIWGRYEFR